MSLKNNSYIYIYNQMENINKIKCFCCNVFITKNNFTRHTQTIKHAINEERNNYEREYHQQQNEEQDEYENKLNDVKVITKIFD